VQIYFLKAKQEYTAKKNKKIINIVHANRCRYEILEQKEVPLFHRLAS
jgi:hypothetical protein